ncbi:MAG: hypothetical protein KTR30_04335 [Saprospiraceae bacterium]|nr:hypothetical protein [Saprospiraceae bacterium]
MNSSTKKQGQVVEINERIIQINRNGVQVTRMGKPNNRVLKIKLDQGEMILKLENEVQELVGQLA